VTRAIWLAVGCYILWLLLSGFYDNVLLLSFGVLSCGVVVWLTWRMEAVDPEEDSLILNVSPQILLYWPWLFWQIVLSTLDVTKRILDRDLPISPTLVRLEPTQRTELGQVIYANSITLTPGTVSTLVQKDKLEVHALTQKAADELIAGAMDRRVSELEVPES